MSVFISVYRTIRTNVSMTIARPQETMESVELGEYFVYAEIGKGH